MSNTVTRIDRELMRGAGPVAVLQLLSSGEKYGYEMTRELACSTDGVLDIGQATLYPLLYNLESKGLVKGRWRTAASGRRRKYYGLTARVRRRLEAHQEQWQRLFGAMEGLGLVETGED